MGIAGNVESILKELPAAVTLVVATKGRTADEVREAVAAGVTVIGENYVQEAAAKRSAVGRTAAWHCIGHLQRNKVREALDVFDAIQTVDSLRLAEKISREAGDREITARVLIEINSGREPNKSGVMPEDAGQLLRDVCALPGLRIEGLMTMGTFTDNPEAVRPCFALTRKLFEEFRALSLPNVAMKCLSMGMSDSWRAAVEEGATMVRIGTAIFGPRLQP